MEITKIDGTEEEIKAVSESAKNHLKDDRNYVPAILAQFIKDGYSKFITKEDRVILDIGANIGLFALYVSPFAEKIVCVEPTPEHITIAKEILKGLPVEFEEAALSDRTGTVSFSRNPENSTTNAIGSSPDSVTVKSLSLEDLCKLHNLTRVDFCKIDIEGGEWLAITPETLKPVYKLLNKVYIELHPCDQAARDKMTATFDTAGYVVKQNTYESLVCYKPNLYQTVRRNLRWLKALFK